MKQAKTIAVIFLALLILGGCSNLNSRKDSQVEIVNQKLLIPIELGISARSAMPAEITNSALGEKFFFAAALTDGSAPDVSGLQEAEYESTTSGARLAISYEPSATAQSFTVYVYAFDKTTVTDIEQVKGFADLSAALFSGRTTVSIAADSSTATFASIILFPYSASTVKGSVELKIKIPDGYSLATNCVDSGGNQVAEFTQELPPADGVCTLSVNEVVAGSYTVDFLLKTGTETVYTRTEVINVYPGMKTEKWVTWGTSITYSDYITIAVSSVETTYYVFAADSTNALVDPIPTDGNGTIGEPYDTVQKAIDHIAAINDGTTAYTIYIDGTFEAESGSGNAFIQIENNSADKSLSISIIGYDDSPATLKGNGNKVFYVLNSTSPVNLKLENLKITNGNSESKGAGIRFEANGESTLDILNCEFYQNVTSTSANGGGLCMEKGSLTISGGKFEENNAAGNGGGIYINSGCSATISGCTFESNQADKGAGVYMAGDVATFSGCAFTSNTATNGGSGIYSKSASLTLGGTMDFTADNIFIEAAIILANDFDIASDAVSGDPKKIGVCMADASYAADTQVLSGTIDQDVCDKFTLLDSSGAAQSDWNLVPNGNGTAGVLEAVTP